MSAALHNFKIAATGRWAVALPVFLLTVPFGFLVALERESALNPDFDLHDSILITTAGYMASFLYLFVAQATLLRNRNREPQSLIKCLFVWYITGVLQGAVSAFYAHTVFSAGWDLLPRTGPAAFYTGTALALIAFYFGSIERRRVEDEALHRLNFLLSVDKGELVSSDALARSEAVAQVNEVLKPQIEKLQSLLSNGALSSRESTAELISKSGEISESLSKQANAVASSRDVALSGSDSEYKRISFLSGIFPHTLSVRISVLVIAFGSLTGQFPRNGINGVIAGECGVVLIGILLFLLSKLVKRQERAGRWRFLIASYVLVFCAQSAWTVIAPKIGFIVENPYPAFYSGMKTLYGVYLASIVSSLVVETSTRLEESKESSSRAIDDVAYLTQEQELLEQHLFTTRFGTIQGKISGVIMALRILEATPAESPLASRRESLATSAQALLGDALREIEELGTIREK